MRYQDRIYFEGIVDEYLEALVKNEPTAIPLANDVVFVENDQILTIGDGGWRTVNATGRYRHYFVDPEMGNAGLIANIMENDLGAILILRIKVQNDLITEVDQFIIRDPHGAELYEKMGAPDPVWLEPVPPECRQNRKALEATAYMYFQSLERNDGSGIYPFLPECIRIEHGRQTVKQKNVEGYGHADTNVEFVNIDTVTEQYQLGLMAFISRIRDRYAAVVDVERGVVLGQSSFDFDGTLKKVTFADGRVWNIPPYFRTPRSHQMNEVFKIINGSFRFIEATLFEVPFYTRQRWPGHPMNVELEYEPTSPEAKPLTRVNYETLKALGRKTICAMVDDCPHQLPLARTIRYTENGVPVNIGEGVWKTFQSIGSVDISLADIEKCTAGWFGSLNESGLFALAALRIYVKEGLITEIEVLIARPEKPGKMDELREATFTMFTPPLLVDLDPAGFDKIPEPLSVSTTEASSHNIANTISLYTQAIQQRDALLAPVADTCTKRENGVPTKSETDCIKVQTSEGEHGFFADSIKQEINKGLLSRLTYFRDHRVWMVDSHQGLALDIITLDNQAASKEIASDKLGQITVPEPFLTPWTDYHVRLFKVENDVIVHIEELVRRVPYGQNSI